MRRDAFLIGEFAAKAAVTVRTVRYYDQVGLLPPAAVTESGQRRSLSLMRCEVIIMGFQVSLSVTSSRV